MNAGVTQRDRCALTDLELRYAKNREAIEAFEALQPEKHLKSGPLFESTRPCREHPEVDAASIPPLSSSQCWEKWPNAWDPDDFVNTGGEPRRKTSSLAAPRGRRATLLGKFLCGSIGPYFAPPMKQETESQGDDQGPDSTDPDHDFGESVDEYEARLARATAELDAAHELLMAGATIHNEVPTQ